MQPDCCVRGRVATSKVARTPGVLRVSNKKDRGPVPFGHALRAKRVEKEISLRKFAELVGVSPTYLSQVEQCNLMPPTTDRIKRMAELLGEDADKWIMLAGRIPDDISRIISEHPTEVARLLRAIRGMSGDRIQMVCEKVEGMMERGDRA